MQKSHQNICTDNDSNKNIKEPAQTVTFVTDLDEYLLTEIDGIKYIQGKACIIAVNKWDAIEKDGNTMKEYRDKLTNDFSFMSYAPIMFISAKTGQRIDTFVYLAEVLDTTIDYLVLGRSCMVIDDE